MSAVRTGLLIGGPCDGQAARVVAGQSQVIVPFLDHSQKLTASVLYDPATPDAERVFSTAFYVNQRMGGIPETVFEFFTFSRTER